jgi:hypothetical protein
MDKQPQTTRRMGQGHAKPCGKSRSLSSHVRSSQFEACIVAVQHCCGQRARSRRRPSQVPGTGSLVGPLVAGVELELERQSESRSRRKSVFFFFFAVPGYPWDRANVWHAPKLELSLL